MKPKYLAIRSKIDEQNVIIVIGRIPCFVLKKFASCYVLEVTTILNQTHLDAVLHVVCSASQYHAVRLLDFICNVLSQCTNCAWFIMEHLFLNIVP